MLLDEGCEFAGSVVLLVIHFKLRPDGLRSVGFQRHAGFPKPYNSLLRVLLRGSVLVAGPLLGICPVIITVRVGIQGSHVRG